MNRAFVTQDLGHFDLANHLVNHRGDTISVGQPTDIVFANQDDQSVHTPPTLRMPEDMARSLLDALSRHFGGSTDVQTLRGDYLAERKRVDIFIAHLTNPLRSLNQ